MIRDGIWNVWRWCLRVACRATGGHDPRAYSGRPVEWWCRRCGSDL